MSSGHRHKHSLPDSELDELLTEVLANAKIKKRLANPFKLSTEYDVPYLGSSSIGGGTVYLDRHLRYHDWPYGILPLSKRRIDVKPPLIRHERLEQAIENELHWSYLPYAHHIAQRWEEQWVKLRGFSPVDYERMLTPFIKSDEREKLKKVPTDMDLRPELSPPKSDTLLEAIYVSQNREKRSHVSVGYIQEAKNRVQRCEKCFHYLAPEYFGKPGCEGVKDEIDAGGWCRRFKLGEK